MNASSRIDLGLHLARRRAAGLRHVWLGRVRADVKNMFFFCGAIAPDANPPPNGFIGWSFKPSMMGFFFFYIFLNFKKNFHVFLLFFDSLKSMVINIIEIKKKEITFKIRLFFYF